MNGVSHSGGAKDSPVRVGTDEGIVVASEVDGCAKVDVFHVRWTGQASSASSMMAIAVRASFLSGRRVFLPLWMIGGLPVERE